MYATEGFAIVIDDVIFPDDAAQLEREFLSAFNVHKVLLRPRLEVALFRNATRQNKDFNTAILEPVIKDLYANMQLEAFQNAGWTVLDSSDLNLETTIRLMLEQHTLNDDLNLGVGQKSPLS
jgi:hypothetical protein